MKKTIITAVMFSGLLLSASAQAESSASLLAEWNGFTLTDATNNTAAATTGSLTLDLNNGGTINDGVLSVTSQSSLTDRPQVDVSSLGMSIDDGFTVSVMVTGYNANTGNIFALANSEEEHLLGVGTGYKQGNTSTNNYAYVAFDGSFSNIQNGATQSQIPHSNAYTLITFTAVTTQDNIEFAMYKDGTLVFSGTSALNSTLTSDDLTLLALGGWAGSSTGSKTNELLERLAIYSGAMTAADVAAQYTAWTSTPAIPEPTTATLSLLALAGLAARRRRK